MLFFWLSKFHIIPGLILFFINKISTLFCAIYLGFIWVINLSMLIVSPLSIFFWMSISHVYVRLRHILHFFFYYTLIWSFSSNIISYCLLTKTFVINFCFFGQFWQRKISIFFNKFDYFLSCLLAYSWFSSWLWFFLRCSKTILFISSHSSWIASYFFCHFFLCKASFS